MQTTTRQPLLDVVLRRVAGEPDLWVWWVFDGTDTRLGHHFGEDGLAAWLRHRYPGPFVVRCPAAVRLATTIGPQATPDPVVPRTMDADLALKSYTTATVASLPRLQVATDGAADSDSLGLGWVGSDGRHGARGWRHPAPRPANALRAEAFAVADMVGHLNPGRRVDLLMDSRAVLADVQRAVAGEPVRHGSVFLPSTLARLAQMDLRASWVKGHRGHPLNETADRLAVYARRCITAGVEPRHEQLRCMVAEGLANSVA